MDILARSLTVPAKFGVLKGIANAFDNATPN
jgi:hypothetical protein